MKQPSSEVLQALQVVTVVIGQDTRPETIAAIALELAQYPDEQVLGALARCKLECKYRLSLADVIERIDDGRPGAEEAWAMLAKDEGASCVMSEGEMNLAMGAALPLMQAGDLVAARMAFKQAYEPLVAQARAEHRPVKWFASLGHDPGGRVAVLEDAVRRGRLSLEQAQGLLPHHELRDPVRLATPTAIGKLLAKFRKDDDRPTP